MPGIPRSKGCHLCVKRRIKCDEARPNCGNCDRYRAVCPGYYRSHKFITNKYQIRPRSQRNAPSAIARYMCTSSNCSFPSSQHGDASDSVVYPRRTVMYTVPRVDRGSYINTLLNTLHSSFTSNELTFLHPWFHHLQDRLGVKVTLDSATMSLVLHMLGKNHGDPGLISESLALYGQALGALQLALNSKSEWSSTETICTTIILCFFEMFAGTASAISWMNHARAVAWLIQKRGPKAYSSGWDLEILKSFRPILIMNCFWTGQDCFLDDIQWQTVLNHIGHNKYEDPLSTERQSLVNSHFGIMAKIPRIIRLIYPLYQARRQGLLLPLQTQELLPVGDHIKCVYDDLEEWSVHLQSLLPGPIEVESQDSTSPWTTILTYENPWVGSLYMGYWTTKIILQEGLTLIKDLDGSFEGTDALLDKILRSSESVGTGIMGPYRISYGLRVGYDFSSAPKRLWIKSQLEKYEKTYAGLDAREFVAPDESSQLLS